MERARSRLQSPSSHSHSSAAPTQSSSSSSHHSTPPKTHAARLDSTAFIQKYIPHLPALIISLVLYGLLFTFMIQVRPAAIANWLLPQTYLPFQLLLFLANFFFFSFVLISSRRGLLLTLAVQIIVLLKLQSIIINWQSLIFILVLFGIIELSANLIQSITSRRKK